MNPKIARARLIVCVAVLLSASGALAAEGEFHRTLKVTGPVNLQVETGSGSIQVRNGGSSEVVVTGHIRQSNWGVFGDHPSPDAIQRLQDNPPIQQSGNDIRVGHIDDPALKRGISISYELVVPATTNLHSATGSGNQDISGIAGPVDAKTGSGSVHVSDIGSGVRAESGSGNIDVSGAKGNVLAHAGSGSIRAMDIAGGFDGQTGSGNLTLEQTSQGSVRAETGSGGLELRNVHGSLQAHAGSGSIRADGDPSGSWTVRTGSGSVNLRFPQNASFQLDAHTGSGSINLNHPVTVQGSINRREVHGKVGGGGVPVQVETGSGSIAID
jgi:putative adhesin